MGLRFVVFTAMLLAMACAGGSYFECPAIKTLERKAMPRTFFTHDRIRGSGNALPPEWDTQSLDGTRVPIRVGEWTYQHPNGRVAGRVSYSLSCYTQCCSAGPCPHVHDYQQGSFQVWYPSGRKQGEGSFIATRIHVDTSCEGGGETWSSTVSPSSRFWREDGTELVPRQAAAEGLMPALLLWAWPAN